MGAWPQFALGLTLASTGWLLPRRVAGTPLRWHPALPLDAMAPSLGWVAVIGITARPIFSGIAILALFAGFALADAAKRTALLEPVVFSDMSELIEVFRHPRLYLPFAGTGRVIGGAFGAAAALTAILLIEPPVWPAMLWSSALGMGLLAALGLAAGRPPLLGHCAHAVRRLGAVGEPMRDAATCGPLAMLLIYGVVARAERPFRRAAARAPAVIAKTSPGGPPVILIQGESFFDARRIHPAVPQNLLPAFEACCHSGLQFGQLAVTGWGANTTRTEFAALTGLSDEDLGFDRFNAYHAFARVPIASLAWRMRSLGYRTLCIHPFDRTFYRRDRIMPNLGFDAFLGEEAFAGAKRSGPYIADSEVAELAIELLREEGPGIFVFGITMENHGPWLSGDPRGATSHPAPGLPSLVEGEALKCFLNGLRSADAMLEKLMNALSASEHGGVLTFYGDHVPSFPVTFKQLGYMDPRTDYAIWDAQRRGGTHCNLAAHQLPQAVWDAIAGSRLRADEGRSALILGGAGREPDHLVPMPG